MLSRKFNLRIGEYVERVQFIITEFKENYDLFLGIFWFEDYDSVIGWADRILYLRCGGRVMVVRDERLCTVQKAIKRFSIQMVILSKILRDCKKVFTEGLLFLIREKQTFKESGVVAGYYLFVLVEMLVEFSDVLVDGLSSGLSFKRSVDYRIELMSETVKLLYRLCYRMLLLEFEEFRR